MKIMQKSERVKNTCKSNVRFYSNELEFLRSSAVKELRRRGYDCVEIEKPVERGDGSMIYVKVYAMATDVESGLPCAAVECFREVSSRVSKRTKELRKALHDCRIVLVFPECLAVGAAKYADDGDEVWLVDAEGNVACYGGGDVEGLKTHLRNKVMRRVQQAREEIQELLREYEEARYLLRIFTRGLVYTQAPLRALFAVSAKLVLGEKFYPELADVRFLGPYHERVIECIKRLREIRGKISEKIVEVADEILKIETIYGIERRGESLGEPLYHVKHVKEEGSTRDKPLVPPLEYLAERYMTDGLEDVKRCLELQGNRQPVEDIHSYIMDEVVAELSEAEEKMKNAKRAKRRTREAVVDGRGECVTLPRKVLENMLEEVREMRKILEGRMEAGCLGGNL